MRLLSLYCLHTRTDNHSACSAESELVSDIHTLDLFGCFLGFYLFTFRKRESEWEREGEKQVRDTWIGSFSHAPYWGPGQQPRHMPWLGTELVTFWFTGWAQSTEPHQPGLHQILSLNIPLQKLFWYSEGHSHGQLVIGSFITTMHPLLHHVLCRVFWWSVKSPRWLNPRIA